jgi:hypothetical protein
MAGDGVPELATKRCGELIACLRAKRRWSRPHLVRKLLEVIDADDPLWNTISDAWLARLEGGHIVKLSRQTIEMICLALNCTKFERLRVLSYADRNILADVRGLSDDSSDLILIVMDYIHNHPNTMYIVEKVLNNRSIPDITHDDLIRFISLIYKGVKSENTHLAQVLHITRQFLDRAFDSTYLMKGVFRGSIDTAFLLIEGDDITLSVRRQSEDAWNIIINSNPPLSGWIIARLGTKTFRSPLNEDGVAYIRNVPENILLESNGPDLSISLEIEQRG